MKGGCKSAWIRALVHFAVLRPFVRLFCGVHITGSEHLQHLDRFIIIANHNSHLDVFLLFQLLSVRDLEVTHPVADRCYFSRSRLVHMLARFLFQPIWVDRGVQDRRQDPLQGRRISLTWLEALYAWNDRLTGYGQHAGSVMILQGTKDSVVDWRYNIAALQQIFTTIRLVWIEGGRHQLFNESPPIRATVLDAVAAYLQQSFPALDS